MTDLAGWIGDFLTIEIATIGTTVVTLGLMVALSLIAGLALGVIRRVRGRG